MPVLCESVNVAASGARWKPCHRVWPCDGGVVWKRAARPRRPHRAGRATMVGRARAYEVNTPENMADERVILTLAQTPWLIPQFTMLSRHSPFYTGASTCTRRPHTADTYLQPIADLRSSQPLSFLVRRNITPTREVQERALCRSVYR